MVEFDPEFIQAVEHRPKTTPTEADGIPTIDLSAISSLDHLSNNNLTEQIGSLVTEIGEACEKWGFFQVINHGVPLQKLHKMEETAREFFALPSEEKRKLKGDETNPMGYYDVERTKNVRDWKQVFDFTVRDRILLPVLPDQAQTKQIPSRWPTQPSEFREVARDYAKELEKLAFKLVELIALSLGLPANRLNGFFDDHTSYVRLNHYPTCPIPELALGIGRHKDSGAITILAQDSVGGLEVKRKSDGEWVRVKPTPGAFIINVGAVVQVWSNDKYESVEHRALVNTEKDRLSIPFFFHPSHTVMVKPLEELINEQNGAKYRAYSWGKFLAVRKINNFKKLEVSASKGHHHQHKKDSKHFVLVHGACLGAWSWYRLVPLLKSSGHRVTAIDLASSGINLSQVNDVKSFSDYSKPLMDFMASMPSHQKVILVGHSLGGASISQAMENFPEKVSVGVFLTAAMPGPSLHISEFAQMVLSRMSSALDNNVTFGDGPSNPPTTFMFGPKFISDVVYQYSPAEDAALATMLVRPLGLVSGAELVFTEAKYGSVKRVFIIAEEDQVLTEDLQKWMIEKNPPTKVLTVKGSDHMVMTSQPTKVLAHLLKIAKNYS